MDFEPINSINHYSIGTGPLLGHSKCSILTELLTTININILQHRVKLLAEQGMPLQLSFTCRKHQKCQLWAWESTHDCQSHHDATVYGNVFGVKKFFIGTVYDKNQKYKKKFEVLHLNTCADFLASLQWLYSTAMVPSYPQHFPMEISAIHDSSAHMYVSFSYPDRDLEFSSCISTLK